MKQLNNVLFIILCVMAYMVLAMHTSAASVRKIPLIKTATPAPPDTTRGVVGYYFQDAAGGGHFTSLVFDRVDPNFWINWAITRPIPGSPMITFLSAGKDCSVYRQQVPILSTPTPTMALNLRSGILPAAKRMVAGWS
jgi:hypothetical protein